MAALQQLLPQSLLPPLDGQLYDLVLCVYIAVAVLVLRVATESLAVPLLQAMLPPLPPASAAAAGADDAPPKKFKASNPKTPALLRAERVFDNAWTALSAGVLVVGAWVVMLYHNGDCTPINTKPCLVGWPDIPYTQQFRVYWLTLLGFYLYEMLGTALGTGCILSFEMVVHHVITMTLMVFGYFQATHRYGLMGTALLDVSNPLLHAAKALKYAALPGSDAATDAAFKLFALVFFVARVVMPPSSLLYPGIVYGRALPLAGHLFANGLMFMIYALQLFWFAKIVAIARGGGEEAKAKAKAKAA